MRPYVWVLILFAAVGAAVAWRTASVPEARAGGNPGSTSPGVLIPSPAPPASPAPTPRLSRNPFEYAEAEGVPVRPLPLPAVKTPRPSPSPTESASTPRLVGFLSRRGALKAILSLRGEVFVLAVGEVGGGYTLLAADEERGARLRGPDRSEVDLPLPGPSGN